MKKLTTGAASAKSATRVSALKTAAAQTGLPGFLAGFVVPEEENQITIHFENLKMSDAFRIAIAAFKYAIQRELELNPGYSAAKRRVFEDLSKDFSNVIAQCNAKSEALNKVK